MRNRGKSIMMAGPKNGRRKLSTPAFALLLRPIIRPSQEHEPLHLHAATLPTLIQRSSNSPADEPAPPQIPNRSDAGLHRLGARHPRLADPAESSGGWDSQRHP